MSHSVLSARFWSTLAVVILFIFLLLFTGHVELFAQTPNSPVGGPESGIYIMNADGSQPHQLIHFKDSRWQGWPQWSHDGKQIAVEVWPANVKGADTHVFTLPAEGGEPKDLGLGKNPSWTGDDKQIVFAIRAAIRPTQKTAPGS